MITGAFASVILPEHLFTEQATDDVSATRLSTSLSFAEVEKEAIINAARVTGGRIQEMSALLGIGRTTLWRKNEATWH
ncbi:helix-turn-helix domain-containing protein [Escherichia coli]